MFGFFGMSLFAQALATASGGGGSTTITPYLGQVATRSVVPTNTVAQTRVMSRVAMYATEALSSYRLKFGAWHTGTSSGAEDTASIGSTVTYTASIEYPAGTFTQIKWGGVATGTAAIGGDTGLCDAITTAIPAGAKFFVRVYATTTAAGIPVSDQNPWNSGGDASVIDGSATDLTLSGTVTGANPQGIFPLCVVQTTTRPTFLLVGDSRTAYAGQDAFGNGGQFAGSFGTSYGYMNVAKGGSFTYGFVDAGARRAALAQYASHVINGFGINDIIFNATSVTVLKALFQTIAYSMPGKPHIIATISPDSSSTDTWATLGNQTVNANDAIRVAFNTWARSLPDPFFACVDIASVTESGSTGKWVPGYTTDGLHQNSTGASAIISAAVVNPATLGANAGLLRFSPLEYSPVDWYNAADAYHAGGATLRPVWGVGQLFSGSATYGATSFNGGPGYALTGAGDYWYQTGDIVSQNASGIMVAALWQPSANPSALAGLWGYSISTSNGTARAMIVQDASGNPGLAITRLDTDTQVTAFRSIPLTIGSPYLLVLQCDVANGVAYLYANGVLACQANYAASGSTSNTGPEMALISFLGGKGAYGTFGEVIGFNVASATTAVRQKLEADMAWRRGAPTTFLPNTHPYYSVRPPN